ncbi:MAG TPA: DUF4135 domain-containing protein, partial [Mycobacterium sp.]
MLSCAFETVSAPRDVGIAQHRLAQWCAASARGDWAAFANRLRRDGLVIGDVRARFEAPRLRVGAEPPRWFADAQWVQEALCGGRAGDDEQTAYPFEPLLSPLADAAAGRLWAAVGCAADRFSSSARGSLRSLLLAQLCHLCAAALYERFVQRVDYRAFLQSMKDSGLQQLFDEKPVLLRLLASSTRQWLDTSREFVERLDSDLAQVRRTLLSADSDSRVELVGGGLSDPHRGGHSVLSVQFGDGRTVMYKPKDLRIDVAWRALVEQLNADAPITLRTARVVAGDGYGWTEFVDHRAAADADGCRQYFRRVGAWLALFHCFAAGDMHQDNLIAASDHPVPVDLETILQPDLEQRTDRVPEAAAANAAREMIANSVLSVGLLPVFARSPDNDVYSVGGVAADAGTRRRLRWVDVNSDSMRPEFVEENNAFTNLPTLGGRPVRVTEHLDDLVGGFGDYSAFLMRYARTADLFT